MAQENVIIMGAAGRDFHNFNTYFRDNPDYRVVAFTAAQIPNIEGRRYPPSLAGEAYPEGISINPEAQLVDLIVEHHVSQVIFAYSDVTHEYVMQKASLVLATGADFRLMGPYNTQIRSDKPVVSVCAVRTGCGKSQTSRRVHDILQNLGYRANFTIYDTNDVRQTIKRVVTSLLTTGVSGNDPEEMIAWRKEVEDLIGLEEMYQIESDTVER